MANYDEDLFDNPFFLAVQKHYISLFHKAVAQKALLCIPKYSECAEKKIVQSDVEDHILIPEAPDNEDNDHYRTLSGKELLIAEGKLKTGKGFKILQSVSVIFEETFHSENDYSYRVLCISHFLNSEPGSSSVQNGSTSRNYSPSTYDQCLDLLWSHSGGQKTRDNLDKMLAVFARIYYKQEIQSVRSLVDIANAHFTKAMQLLLKDSVVRRSAKHNTEYMDALKVAVETYLMNTVHLQLFPVITAVVASEDAEINKMTRNLTDLQLQDIGIRPIFSQNIPPAKKELSALNKFCTPLGRLFCIKRVVTALTRPLKHSGQIDDSTAMMTTDDFLPILIFLIIKSEIPNWTANLVYMRYFHFAKSSDDDEFGFYLASVEAALEHIKSGYITEDMKTRIPRRQRWSFLDLNPTIPDLVDEEPNLQRQTSKTSVTDEFFKRIQDGDEEVVRDMLKPQQSAEEISIKLCHPLCSCDKCEKVQTTYRNNFNLVTAYTRDNRGYTALHMAAYYGQGKLIDLLVNNQAVVDATDYLGLSPLHLACQRGHQNVMLLLLHYGADIMARDNEGNTPLHHCCHKGHEDCVKGLIFFNNSLLKLDINAVNEIGDTALHMAAKWGYESIVNILLGNGALATIKNRKRQSPIHVAQNFKVQRLLQAAAEGFELSTVSSLHSQLDSKDARFRSTSSASSSDSHKHSFDSQSSKGFTSSCFETASLDDEQNKELQKKKDRLFKAIIVGDIQLVKFYLGIQGKVDDQQSDEDCQMLSDAPGILSDLCHPLCQCPKCQTIHKARQKIYQILNINIKDASGYTPLHMAVLYSYEDMVHLFLCSGSQVNTQNHKSCTPLHTAAVIKMLPIMERLVQSNAKVNVRDNRGDTPLHICSANGFMAGVNLLLQHGADVNLVNHRGNSALHEASEHMQVDIVRVLLEAGADPTLRNKQTQTAFNLAKDINTENILQSAMADWQKKHMEQRPRSISKRVAATAQVGAHELFAAFEEKDLETLKALTAAIRTFHKEGSLRKAITLDKSRTLLASLSCSHAIQNFDHSSLRFVEPCDKSSPLHMLQIYSLTNDSYSLANSDSPANSCSQANTDFLVSSDSLSNSHSQANTDSIAQSKEGCINDKMKMNVEELGEGSPFMTEQLPNKESISDDERYRDNPLVYVQSPPKPLALSVQSPSEPLEPSVQSSSEPLELSVQSPQEPLELSVQSPQEPLVLSVQSP